MDWAEELKMSIRKKTARRGRRSKSRDLDAIQSTSPNSSTVVSPNVNKEISIDITLDVQPSSGSLSTTTTATQQSSGTTAVDSDKRPPIRRISGGWADSGVLKSSKFKRSSFDDERFQLTSPKSSTNSPLKDDIPIIPDMDEIKDELLLNEIAEPPSVTVNRVVTLKELNSEDLLSQNAFSAIEDVDLSILTRCLQAQDSLDEADKVWEWDKLFTAVIAEIHSDKVNNLAGVAVASGSAVPKPDEIPPAMHA